MAIERERKFLVNPAFLPMDLQSGRIIESGYFTSNGVAIRVTLRDRRHLNPMYKVCFKSPGGLERQEFEYKIPEEDAEALMKLSPTHLTKIRFDYNGWEIDSIELPGEETLWVAEWEEDGKKVFPTELPKWISGEVTGNPDYSMQSLCWKYGKKSASTP